MKPVFLIFNRDYKVLCTNRASSDEHCHHSRCNLVTLLCVNNNELPPAPNDMHENPLPPNLAVSEPVILKYFSTFLGDFPLLERAEAQLHYHHALLPEIVGMIAGVLADHYYWKGRVWLIPDSTYDFIDRSVTKTF